MPPAGDRQPLGRPGCGLGSGAHTTTPTAATDMNATAQDRHSREGATLASARGLPSTLDRRHTGLLTKMLTIRLAKTSGSCQTHRSPAMQDGVSEGTRTPDTQDHNLVL